MIVSDVHGSFLVQPAEESVAGAEQAREIAE